MIPEEVRLAGTVRALSHQQFDQLRVRVAEVRILNMLTDGRCFRLQTFLVSCSS